MVGDSPPDPDQTRRKLATTSRSQPELWPACNRQYAAAPIIAALSVHSAGEGANTGLSALEISLLRSKVLTDTPPATNISWTSYSRAAATVFAINASITAI